MMHRNYLFAPILAGAAFSVSGQRYAMDEFDLATVALIGNDAGTVEAVREMPIARHPHAFIPDVAEHRLHAETAEQVVIRMDSGLIITVPRDPTLRIQPGQRVRVQPSQTMP
jgi:hypothetical protein